MTNNEILEFKREGSVYRLNTHQYQIDICIRTIQNQLPSLLSLSKNEIIQLQLKLNEAIYLFDEVKKELDFLKQNPLPNNYL